jgi:hypothetical protein
MAKAELDSGPDPIAVARRLLASSTRTGTNESAAEPSPRPNPPQASTRPLAVSANPAESDELTEVAWYQPGA